VCSDTWGTVGWPALPLALLGPRPASYKPPPPAAALAGVNHSVGKVAGIAGRPDFISDPEGEALPALTSRGRVTVVITITQEGGGQRLQVSRAVHGGCSLANSACTAGEVDDHETLTHFHTYENPYTQPYKNIRNNARGLGQMVKALCVRNQDL
jgi:hypothetical protein